eukprot:3541148-Rhodomonas_salina.1
MKKFDEKSQASPTSPARVSPADRRPFIIGCCHTIADDDITWQLLLQLANLAAKNVVLLRVFGLSLSVREGGEQFSRQECVLSHPQQPICSQSSSFTSMSPAWIQATRMQ